MTTPFDIVAPPEIIAAFDYAKREGQWLVTICPNCGKGPRDRKLRAGIYKGKPWWGCMRCHCEKEFWDRKKAQRMPLKYDPARAQRDEIELRMWALTIWEKTSAIKPGDPVDRYLREQRKLKPIGREWPTELRWGRIWHSGMKRDYDGMVAAVRDVAGGFLGIHRTYLLPDGQRADGKDVPTEFRLSDAKKAAASITGGAIRLGFDPLADTIGVAEGIESALALCMRLDFPCWSTVSANGMRALRVPSEIRKVIIGPDLGDPGGKDGHGKHEGMNAAFDLRRRLLEEAKQQQRRLAVEIMPPPFTDRGDWADWAKLQKA